MRATRFLALALLAAAWLAKPLAAANIWIEAESFEQKGGWQVDQQMIEGMGSPYLIAHGLGTPVKDALTSVRIDTAATYNVYVRTYNWTAPWHAATGPGGFKVAINGKRLPVTVGQTGDRWQWQKAGTVNLKRGMAKLALCDLTGFDGRCDAICLSTSPVAPPEGHEELRRYRDKMLKTGQRMRSAGVFDLVVVGGGVAGMSAAVAAARLGLKVALVQDRPVLGGNNSSEVRVHLGGRINTGKYPRLGDLQKEFGPTLEGNAMPAENYADDRKLKFVKAEPNVSLFLNHHVCGVQMQGQHIPMTKLLPALQPSAILPKSGTNASSTSDFTPDVTENSAKCEGEMQALATNEANKPEGNRLINRDNTIAAVIAKNVLTGEELRFEAPLFADCTGDATLGVLAGAMYTIGRESKSAFGEDLAPQQADDMTMGVSMQWYAKKKDKATTFPLFEYGISFNEQTAEKRLKGEWTWETGLNSRIVDNLERVRDYGMLVVYSNWSFLKNRSKDRRRYERQQLDWLAYVAGKRESRRLLGDYVLSEQDIVKNMPHEDATFTTTWSIDLHYPDTINARNFATGPFKAISRQRVIYPYAVPYRCLYSRNVSNLFMAGRNISVTHVALGSVRVMRTTGMMGEVVGMAASVCHANRAYPRQVYTHFLPQLQALMERGVGNANLPNNQNYNEGWVLEQPPRLESKHVDQEQDE
ncbi:FAD-dependent oxidoreductase [Hoylesella loescheii]|uniref:FAD-dependent oxidoreductase n=1 Tax=Hoylesella loescheii TaxID=840 RepID=UPI0028E31948|nr:FAD-dependent oxidoreductase [Hoylesella loescheii]